MCTCALLYRNLMPRIHFCSVIYVSDTYASGWFLKTMHSGFLKGSTYFNFDTEFRRISQYPWIAYDTRRFHCSSANTDGHFTLTASEKLKSLKKKKEAKRTERLERQRINELKKNVCICCGIVLVQCCLSFTLSLHH